MPDRGAKVLFVVNASIVDHELWYADPEHGGPLARRLEATNGIALLVDGRE